MVVTTRTAARLACVAAMLSVTACSVPRVVEDQLPSAYTQSEVAYAASNRDLRVMIRGNPFGMDAQALGELVTANMQNRIMGVQTHLTTTPDQTARPDYGVVLLFNPAQTTLNSTLCGSAPIPTRPPGPGPLVVQGAFCRSGGSLSSATGWLDQVQGPADPAFKSLISDMTFALFPNRRADMDCGGPDC